MRHLFLIGLCLILGAGCISERHGTQKETPTWQIGKTTPKDVVAQWGNPDFIKGNSWIWWDVDAIGGKFRASYMTLGVTISNMRKSFSGYRLTFSPAGTLSTIEGFETLPGGGKWSVLPW